jgi:hypothetical protein
MANGSIPYPPHMIDKICAALGYNRSDRRYTRRVFQRHERGQATRPERALIDLLFAMITPDLTKLTIGTGTDTNVELEVLEGTPLAETALFRVRRAARGKDSSSGPNEKPWGLGPCYFATPGKGIDPELLRRAKSYVRAINARRCKTVTHDAGDACALIAPNS